MFPFFLLFLSRLSPSGHGVEKRYPTFPSFFPFPFREPRKNYEKGSPFFPFFLSFLFSLVIPPSMAAS